MKEDFSLHLGRNQRLVCFMYDALELRNLAIYTVSEEKGPIVFWPYNFDKLRQLFTIFGMNHLDILGDWKIVKSPINTCIVTSSALSAVGPSLSQVRRSGTRYTGQSLWPGAQQQQLQTIAEDESISSLPLSTHGAVEMSVKACGGHFEHCF